MFEGEQVGGVREDDLTDGSVAGPFKRQCHVERHVQERDAAVERERLGSHKFNSLGRLAGHQILEAVVRQVGNEPYELRVVGHLGAHQRLDAGVDERQAKDTRMCVLGDFFVWLNEVVVHTAPMLKGCINVCKCSIFISFKT